MSMCNKEFIQIPINCSNTLVIPQVEENENEGVFVFLGISDGIAKFKSKVVNGQEVSDRLIVFKIIDETQFEGLKPGEEINLKWGAKPL